MATQEERKNLIDLTRQENTLLEQQKTLALALGNLEQARAAQAQITENSLKLQKELEKDINDLTKEELEILNKVERTQEEIANDVKREADARKKVNFVINETSRLLKITRDYLMQSDKAIKNTILNLGMSGMKAEQMRASFEQSAGFVARLGGSLEDVGTIMGGYADETGRARVLSAQMVEDITAIGKGTGLGVEQATRLGAQFELMGFDARSTMDYVQGVVDTSERMGVNTTKVLKSVNDNFKRLNTYTFQQGVKGFAQMAMYAEKFRIDVNQALNAADVARSLEGAIDLAAQLQVMGGEFSKTDPFELLFLSRNDPAKFTEKIADMTKGVVTFRKMADGSFEKFISPADRDRLAAVAKSLGMETAELTQIAERQAEIQRMRQQMAGMGLSTTEKELIEGAAIFNKETGKFEVQLAGQMQDVTKLTSAQATAFEKEHKSLAARAMEAQTFEDAFKATINELKSALLPLLRAINGVLVAIRPIVIKITEFLTGDKLLPGWAKVAGLFLTTSLILKPLAQRLGDAIKDAVTSKISGRIATKATETVGGQLSGSQMLGKGKMMAGAGKGMAGAGAGVGAAALGIGAGIGAAAAGISLLANAMNGLDEEKALVLKDIVKTLGWTIGIGVGVAAAIMAISVAAGASAGPLMAFGGAVALIGAGIGIAAAGIGVMGMGLAKLVESTKGAGKDMPIVAGGIAAIAASMGVASMALPGAIGMSLAIASIGKNAPKIATVGTSLEKIKTSLTGSREDFLAVKEAVESISNMKVRGTGVFAELANMLSKPLKVEFAQGKVAMVNDITLNLDGNKFMQKAYNVNLAIQKHEALRHGKGELA